MQITRIEAVRCSVGEAPVWDDRDQSLYLLDIPACRLLSLAPETGRVREWSTPAPATALALSAPGEVLIATGNVIRRLELASGTCRIVTGVPDQPANATLNDGRVDRQGRFVIGSCCTDFASPTAVGGIYALDSGRCERVADDIMFSNGTCFSPDGRTLYFADGARHAIYAYDYDPATGTVGERRELANTSSLGGMPDGATVDTEGQVWIAINPGGKVAVFRPDGVLERVIELPVNRPGSVTFGGRNLDRLFVTSIDPATFDEPADEQAGYLYVIDGAGARGLPEPIYRG